VQTFYRPIDIFREQSTGAATRLLQRKKVQIKKSKSRAGGTAGAAVHPKTTDPTSWEVKLPW
jgi:hypothetical protein